MDAQPGTLDPDIAGESAEKRDGWGRAEEDSECDEDHPCDDENAGQRIHRDDGSGSRASDPTAAGQRRTKASGNREPYGSSRVRTTAGTSGGVPETKGAIRPSQDRIRGYSRMSSLPRNPVR